MHPRPRADEKMFNSIRPRRSARRRRGRQGLDPRRPPWQRGRAFRTKTPMSLLPTEAPVCHEEPSGAPTLLLIEGRPRPVGSLTVSRLLPSPGRRMVGPFAFWDHLGPVDMPPGRGFDIGPHPHIGLSTITYLLAGEILHKDSIGSVQLTRPGDLSVMTAGRGI